MTLDLKDPQYPEHNLGSLELAVTLSPKEGDVRDAVRNLNSIRFGLLISFLPAHTITILLALITSMCHNKIGPICFSQI